MKKLSLFYSLLFLVSLGFITSCGDKEDDPTPITPDECASATFPSTSGDATVSFINFPGSGLVTIDANADDVLSIAVDIQKGNVRPQKMRVYQTDCENALGNIVYFKDQPQTNSAGDVIDLRNTDSQVRTVLYTVPKGMNPIYLNFEIDESGGNYTYKRMKINVTGSGIVDTFEDVTLGAQSNSLPSRMASSTGYVYLACETEANIQVIDITYAYSGSGYLSSNPARFEAPIGLTVTSTSACDDGTVQTDGGNPTYFTPASGVSFDTVTDEDLGSLSVSSSNNQYIAVTQGGVYAFQNSQGKKGLIRVVSLSTGVSGTITVDVKVQR